MIGGPAKACRLEARPRPATGIHVVVLGSHVASGGTPLSDPRGCCGLGENGRTRTVILLTTPTSGRRRRGAACARRACSVSAVQPSSGGGLWNWASVVRASATGGAIVDTGWCALRTRTRAHGDDAGCPGSRLPTSGLDESQEVGVDLVL